jgi:glutamyl-tRNA synthetase
MDDLSTLIRKYALQNAVFHDGKAMVNAVMGKVMAENPALSSKAKEVKTLVAQLVEQVNLIPLEKQRKELEDSAPELMKKEKGVRSLELPELPDAGERVVMRLAPYPSGPLHIGNARMVILNDEYVKRHKGKLLLVFDDTIGSEDKTIDREAYLQIREGLEWLGVEIHEVYFKSNRLRIYYHWAAELIKFGYAYVCECSPEQLRGNREKGIECDHRTGTVEDNLEKWHSMLTGTYGEGEAVLRIITDMKHPNPAFRDRVLFRISERHHPRVGSRFRAWPMLEFSWAIDDHLLGITHVLRGKDLVIEDEMEKHIWRIFGIEPIGFLHYGILRLNEMKLSKSRMRADIEEGKLSGIDDPRTWTLQSLRKRGITPEAVRNFILGFGLSLTDIEVPAENLYAENRKLIDKTANRYFFVPEPVEISLKDIPKKELKLSLHPDFKDRGERTLQINHQVYVAKDDFDGLKGKEVRLKDFCNVVLENDAEVTSVENKDIPRIQWVSEHVPVKVLMPDGSTVDGYGEKALEQVKEDEVIQFERFGFARKEAGQAGLFVFAHK